MEKAKNILSKAFFFLFPLLCVAVIWEILVDLNIISPSLIPAPSTIIRTFYSLITPKPLILIHLYKSLYRLSIGYTLGVLIGIGLGILMGINRVFFKALSPIISFLVSIPTIAWVPILLISLGIGDATIIFAIFLGAFFPIVYNTMNGIRGVDRRYIWAAQTMGANNMTIFLRVLLPGSLVSVITGLRLAVGYSWRALVGAEMLAATMWGIGYIVYAARAFYAVEQMFLGLTIIAIGGLLVDRLLMTPLQRKTVEKWGMVLTR